MNASALDILGDETPQQFQTFVMGTRIYNHHSEVSICALRLQQYMLNKRRATECQNNITIGDFLLNHYANRLGCLFDLVANVRFHTVDEVRLQLNEKVKIIRFDELYVLVGMVNIKACLFF